MAANFGLCNIQAKGKKNRVNDQQSAYRRNGGGQGLCTIQRYNCRSSKNYQKRQMRKNGADPIVLFDDYTKEKKEKD